MNETFRSAFFSCCICRLHKNVFNTNTLKNLCLKALEEWLLFHLRCKAHSEASWGLPEAGRGSPYSKAHKWEEKPVTSIFSNKGIHRFMHHFRIVSLYNDTYRKQSSNNSHLFDLNDHNINKHKKGPAYVWTRDPFAVLSAKPDAL